MMRISAVMMYLEKITINCKIKVKIKYRNKKRRKFMEKYIINRVIPTK
jgi:hypothetical protein